MTIFSFKIIKINIIQTIYQIYYCLLILLVNAVDLFLQNEKPFRNNWQLD